MEETKIYLILNEVALQFVSRNREPLKFETYEDANKYASSNCHLWKIIEVWFKDKYIFHLPNVKSEDLNEWGNLSI
jgi:hypothetical protein